MKKVRLQYVIALIAAFFASSSGCVQSKAPVLKGSKWTARQEMFVADAGTMTINHTLEFLSEKDVVVKEEGYLPAHPQMYMNPDGTVDTVPARSFESLLDGTYTFKDGVLTIKTKDGSREYKLQENGTFTRQESWGETLEFSRVKED